MRRTKRSKLGISAPTPAPGELETVQSFVNTASSKGQDDELASPEELGRWLTARKLLTAGTRLTEEDRRRAVEVREGLRALLLGNSGAKVDKEAVARLERAASAARFQVIFDGHGPVRFEPTGQGLDDALGALLGMVAAARLEGLWPQLKACGRGECQRAFFDASRSRSGRWCTRRCGDRMRARAFRQTEKYRLMPKPKVRFSRQ